MSSKIESLEKRIAELEKKISESNDNIKKAGYVDQIKKLKKEIEEEKYNLKSIKHKTKSAIEVDIVADHKDTSSNQPDSLRWIVQG